MKRPFLPIALLAALASACSSPCRTACDRIARCVEDPSVSLGNCSVMCGEVRELLADRPKGPERFDAFVACAEALPYTSPQCGSAFVQCTSIIPPAIMSNALRQARQR